MRFLFTWFALFSPCAFALLPTASGGFVKKVDISETHACALVAPNARHHTGKLFCWGENEFGAFGNAPSLPGSPLQIDGWGGEVKDFSVTYGSTCALLADSRIACRGLDYTVASPQSGPLKQRTTPFTFSIPGDVPLELVSSSAVDSGDVTHCALTGSSRVHCWSAYDVVPRLHVKVLASRADTLRDNEDLNPKPKVLNFSRPVKRLSLNGSKNYCAVLEGGSLKCIDEYRADASGTVGLAWGSDSLDARAEFLAMRGADVQNSDSATDALVEADWGYLPLRDVVTQVLAQNHFDCAVFRDGKAACWGRLGFPDYRNSQPLSAPWFNTLLRPQLLPIQTEESYYAIASADQKITDLFDHPEQGVCFRLSPGSPDFKSNLKCFPFSNKNLAVPVAQLESPHWLDSLPWVPVGFPLKSLAIGRSRNSAPSTSCAVLENNSLKCWGGNYPRALARPGSAVPLIELNEDLAPLLAD